MKEGPNIHIGSPVWGRDFFDRKEIIYDCWNSLRHSSIDLNSPKKYGNTSVMLHLRNNPPEEFYPIYFELGANFNLHGFICELISKISEHDKTVRKTLKKRFSNVFQDIEEISLWKFKIKLYKAIEKESDWEEWKEQLGSLILELLKSKKPKKLLFMFDEFPIMLHNFINEGEKEKNEAIKLLHWLRKLRHESPFLENLRFIFGGSGGMEKTISYLKASRTINDVNRIIIGLFDQQTAEGFIRKIFQLKEIEVNNQVIKSILDVVGIMIPIYLQIMVDSIIKESMNTGHPVTPELVSECYEKRVQGPEYKWYFEDYYHRLCRYYSANDSKSIKRMLRELARSRDGISCNLLFSIYQEEMENKGDREKFDLLLIALESDFYIERNLAEEKVYFHNKWLKDWWRRYH